MGRDDDKASVIRKHACRRRDRTPLIRQMFESSDQQDKLKTTATAAAEFDCLGGVELQARRPGA
jgi:hypothetical protein